MKGVTGNRLLKDLFRLVLWGLVLCGQPWAVEAQENVYPTPERLFHIERSKNRNLVCYDVNLKEGKLDLKNPLEVYWINREEEPGKRKGLNFIQEKFAYGYKVNSKGQDTCEITLKAYPGRVLTLKRQNGAYVCILQINNQPAILKKLYVKAKDNDSLTVEYVELFGETTNGSQAVNEKVYNKK